MAHGAKSSSSPNPSISWKRCIAKSLPNGAPGINVYPHCCQVGQVASALLAILPPRLRKLLGDNPAGVAAIHDIGKVSPGFLKHILGHRLAEVSPELAAIHTGWEHRHAQISEAAINHYFHASRNLRPHPIAIIAGSHHGSRDGQIRYDDLDGDLGGEAWSKERQALIRELENDFGSLPQDIPPQARLLLAGLVTIADWIGSDETYFPPDGSPTAYTPEAAVASCGWTPLTIHPGLSFQDIFQLPAPRSLQQQFIDTVTSPGLYILEAPMGIGKTEAALYAAYNLMAAGHHHGLYFGLPTRLTSDRIHERVNDFVERISPSPDAGTRLAHGHAWLKAYDHGGEAFMPGGEWFRPSKRALLQPFAVGTIDQALLSVINVRHAFVRAFGLAGKVVILDEVHSYDTFTGTLLDQLIAQLLDHGCTVIILSATLTAERRQALVGDRHSLPDDDRYPLITAARDEVLIAHDPPSDTRDVKVTMQDLTDEQIAQTAVEQANSGRCCLLIANTVARAQAWYSAVKSAAKEGLDVGLLHSKYPGWRRDQLEEEWMKKLGKGDDHRPDGAILISTQVCEQSLDLDADWMLSELAPTDMMLQRLGRLHRHARHDRRYPAHFTIITGDLDTATTADQLRQRIGKANTYVYSAYVLWRSHQVWKDLHSLTLPSDIRPLIETTYTPLHNLPAHIHPLWEELLEKRDKLRNHALSAMAEGMPTRNDKNDASTRYSDYPTVDVLLVTQLDTDGRRATLSLPCGKTLNLESRVPNRYASIHLHQNLVSLPQYHFRDAQRPAWLDKHLHDEHTPVLLIGNGGVLHHDSTPTAFSYDDNRGVHKRQQDNPQLTTDEPTYDYGLEIPDW